MPEKIQTYLFSLQLSHREIAPYYQGAARDISVRSTTGQQLRFAARHIRPFLTPEGIHGWFQLTTDEQHRFKSIEKLP